MIASGHILPANVLAVRTNRSATWLFAAMLVAHFVPLDVIPHIEPTTFGIDHLDTHHWTFWWVSVDLAVASLLTLRLFILVPERRKHIVAGYLGAVLPDVLGVGILSLFPHVPMLESIYILHKAIHWWPPMSPFYRILGAITTLAVWIGSFMLMPKPKPTEASDTVEAVA